MTDPVELSKRFYQEILERGNLDAIDELVAEDVVDHQLPPGMPQGREGVRMLMSAMRQAIPDMRHEVGDIVAEGDLVLFRSTMSGTMQAEFMGIPGNGKSFSVGSMDIMRVRDGKFVEHWGIFDAAGMMQQLGLMPAPEAAEGAPAPTG